MRVDPLQIPGIIIGCMMAFAFFTATLIVYSIFGELAATFMFFDIIFMLIVGVTLKNGAN